MPEVAEKPKKKKAGKPVSQTSVQELPASEVPDPTSLNPATKLKETPEKKAGRPAKDGMTFFQRLEHYPRNEWQDGQLVIYSYRIEPFTDRYQGGNRYVFLLKYASPIDEQLILNDHGSGKYHFKLNRAEKGETTTKPIDKVDMEIYNPKYPPKIPPGEWVDDPRNKKWAWGAPAGSQIAADAQANATATQTQGNPVGQLVDTIKAVRELDPPRAAQPASPFAGMVETIQAVQALSAPAATENKQLDTIIQLMTTTLQAAQKEASDMRTLLFQNLAAQKQEVKQPEKNGFGTITEIIGSLKTLIPEIKTLIPDQGVVAKSRMGAWQEFFTEMMPHVAPVITPFAGAISQIMLANAQMAMQEKRMKQEAELAKTPRPAAPAGAPAQLPNGKPAEAPASADPTVLLAEFINLVVNPGLINYLKQDYTGDSLAESLYDLYPTYKGVDWLTMMKAAGPQSVVALYRSSPMWPQLELMESHFMEFVTEFVGWTPEGKPEAEGAAAVAGNASVDLDAMTS